MTAGGPSLGRPQSRAQPSPCTVEGEGSKSLFWRVSDRRIPNDSLGAVKCLKEEKTTNGKMKEAAFASMWSVGMVGASTCEYSLQFIPFLQVATVPSEMTRVCSA